MTKPGEQRHRSDRFGDDEADMDLVDYRKRRSRRSNPGFDPADDLVVDELGRREYVEDPDGAEARRARQAP